MDDNAKLFLFILLLITLAWGAGGSGNNTSPGLSSRGIYSESGYPSSAEKEVETYTGLKKTPVAEGGYSPYKGKVILRDGSTFTDDPDEEYVVLEASPSNESAILLTGWEIRSAETGRSVVFAQGVPRYNFGSINYEENIYLKPGDTAYVTSGVSPVGYSFRVNKCSGFFEDQRDFSPRLSRSCPRPSEEKLPVFPAKYSDACLDYIESLGSCEMPESETMPENLGPDCVKYVTEKINYNSCIDKHRGDSDFDQAEWRIFLKRPDELWKERREEIRLLDANKKVVDTLSY